MNRVTVWFEPPYPAKIQGLLLALILRQNEVVLKFDCPGQLLDGLGTDLTRIADGLPVIDGSDGRGQGLREWVRCL